MLTRLEAKSHCIATNHQRKRLVSRWFLMSILLEHQDFQQPECLQCLLMVSGENRIIFLKRGSSLKLVKDILEEACFRLDRYGYLMNQQKW